MSFLKVNDTVRVKQGAYNIADQRVGMTAKVMKIDSTSAKLPVRIEYPSGCFNWTDYESLELVETAPIVNQHAEVGKEILDRVVELKGLIAARDNAIKVVVEQTEALDALLASYGLKRGEEIPPMPIRVTGPRTALDDVADKTAKAGMKYRMTERDVDYFSLDEVYSIVDTDFRDNDQPLSFRDDDGDEFYPERHELKYFERVV